MLTATLRNVGGSVMVVIPKALLDGLGLTANTKVSMSLDNGRLLVAPLEKPRYTLAQLLAECGANAEAFADDAAWQDMQPVGREFW
ncbi:MAG: AbrB/MazE/SpoVT family DNA-binding domain-containing protein [Chitinophagales bacterium]|nr:AbrB/MazE/SpoVT family DNA-binding domain-containing protein [Chitinophagales bacterium]